MRNANIQQYGTEEKYRMSDGFIATERFSSVAKAVVVMACVLFPGVESEAADTWEWSFTPYIWASDIGLDVAINNQPILMTNVAFSDLLDKVDTALQLHFEGRRNELGFLLDLTYIDISDSLTLTGGMLPAGTIVDTDVQVVIWEAAGIYSPQLDQGRFDVLFGVRAIDLDQKIDITLPMMSAVSVQTGPSLVDGMVGIRYTGDINNHWSYRIRGDIGFGDTESDWNFLAGLAYGFGQTGKYSLAFGWRQMEIEVEEGLVESDLSFAGPIVGFEIDF